MPGSVLLSTVPVDRWKTSFSVGSRNSLAPLLTYRPAHRGKPAGWPDPDDSFLTKNCDLSGVPAADEYSTGAQEALYNLCLRKYYGPVGQNPWLPGWRNS